MRSKLETEMEVAQPWGSAFNRVLTLQSTSPEHESASLYGSGKLSSTSCYDREKSLLPHMKKFSLKMRKGSSQTSRLITYRNIYTQGKNKTSIVNILV